MRRFVGFFFGSVVLTAGLTGCGGSGSSGGGGGNAFPFAGTFHGSDANSGSAGINSDSLTISSTGAITGTSTPLIGSGSGATLGGTVTKAGAVHMTVTDSSGTNTATGTFSFNSAGALVANLTTQGGTVLATFGKSTSSTSIFRGSYTGTFTSSDSTTGSVTMTIAANGALSGTGVPTGGSPQTLSGSVSGLGAVSITGSDAASTGGAAFTSATQLVIQVSKSNDATTVTLTKN